VTELEALVLSTLPDGLKIHQKKEVPR